MTEQDPAETGMRRELLENIDGGRSSVSVNADAEQSPDSMRNPVYEPILADPSVVEADGVWYAFGTEDAWETVDCDPQPVPIVASTDLAE